MVDILDGKKLTYSELIEILASQSAKILRLEEYIVWLNKEISQWSEYQSELALKTKSDMARYKVPYKKCDELEQDLKNYITFNESDKTEIRTLKKNKGYHEYV